MHSVNSEAPNVTLSLHSSPTFCGSITFAVILTCQYLDKWCTTVSGTVDNVQKKNSQPKWPICYILKDSLFINVLYCAGEFELHIIASCIQCGIEIWKSYACFLV